MVPYIILLDTAAKSEHIAQVDPHGWILTLVSVSVVFCALILLFFAYTIVGKVSTGEAKKWFARKDKKSADEEETATAIALALEMENSSEDGETHAAIALALHRYLSESLHDEESYIITIKRK